MMPCTNALQKSIALPKTLTFFQSFFATDAADDDMKLPVSKYHHHQQQQTPPN
jgi:hypothetical protein